jgi:hypothetical protein
MSMKSHSRSLPPSSALRKPWSSKSCGIFGSQRSTQFTTPHPLPLCVPNF